MRVAKTVLGRVALKGVITAHTWNRIQVIQVNTYVYAVRINIVILF